MDTRVDSWMVAGGQRQAGKSEGETPGHSVNHVINVVSPYAAHAKKIIIDIGCNCSCLLGLFTRFQFVATS